MLEMLGRKPIKGFSHYAVDIYGNVWSLKNNKWGLRDKYVKMKPWLGTDNYPKVTLCQDGKRVKRRVHHLVLEAFIGPRPDGMEACHWDGDPQNAKLDNLRWDTPKNNQADRFRHGTNSRGTDRPTAKLNELQVRIIKKMLQANDMSQYEIAKCFGVSRSAIQQIKLGKNWAWLN